MFRREGFTLIEILVVLIIIGLALAFYFPNFTASDEKAWAINAQNNLLAIYSAQQNYNNNNGGNSKYCLSNSAASASCVTSTGDSYCGDTLAAINCNLSLSIQDDGTYLYDCGVTTANACTAKRNVTPSTVIITATLNLPIDLSGGTNPTCTTSISACP